MQVRRETKFSIAASQFKAVANVELVQRGNHFVLGTIMLSAVLLAAGCGKSKGNSKDPTPVGDQGVGLAGQMTSLALVIELDQQALAKTGYDQVAPIIATHKCSKCHGPPSPFDLSAFPFKYPKELSQDNIVNRIIGRVETSDVKKVMPPARMPGAMALDELEKNILRQWQSQGRPLVSTMFHKIVCTLEVGGESSTFEPIADEAGRYTWQSKKLALDTEFKLTVVAVDQEGRELKAVMINEKVGLDEVQVRL